MNEYKFTFAGDNQTNAFVKCMKAYHWCKQNLPDNSLVWWNRIHKNGSYIITFNNKEAYTEFVLRYIK